MAALAPADGDTAADAAGLRVAGVEGVAGADAAPAAGATRATIRPARASHLAQFAHPGFESRNRTSSKANSRRILMILTRRDPSKAPELVQFGWNLSPCRRLSIFEREKHFGARPPPQNVILNKPGRASATRSQFKAKAFQLVVVPRAARRGRSACPAGCGKRGRSPRSNPGWRYHPAKKMASLLNLLPLTRGR